MDAERGKSVLIIAPSDLQSDPRAYRQISALHRDYNVDAAGYAPSGIENVFFRIGSVHRSETMIQKVWRLTVAGAIPAKLVRFASIRLASIRPVIAAELREWAEINDPAIKAFVREAQGKRYDLIIANDLATLPIARKIGGGAKIFFDAHEYYPGQGTTQRWEKLVKPYIDNLLRKHGPALDAMTVPCEGAADLYTHTYALPPIEVIRNTPIYERLSPVFRGDGKIRLVHHGIAGKKRNIDLLINAVRRLDERFSLDLYLVDDGTNCVGDLKALVAGDPRIVIRDPVPRNRLPETLNAYDVGVIFFPPANKNLELALPNKFFECIQARIGVAIGPSPEMEKYVKRYKIGVTTNDFTLESLVDALKSLDPDTIRGFKTKADACALALSGEEDEKMLKNIVLKLIGDGNE